MPVDPVIYDNTETKFVKRVGIIVGKVIAFNPNETQIAKLLGKEPEDIKDPRYEGEDNEGNKKVRLDIWIQEPDGNKQRVKIYLTDKIQTSKSGKFKFIDKKGNLSYFMEDKTKLVKFMQENSPWEARIGEYELYRFLQAYMSDINRIEASSFSIDFDRLMKNDMKELNAFLNQPYTNDIGVLLMVKAEKKEGEIVEYQEIYNKHFLSATKDLEFFQKRGHKGTKRVTEFVKEVSDKEHGPKHYFGGIVGLAKEYVREENPIALRLMNDTPFVDGDDDTDMDDLTADYD